MKTHEEIKKQIEIMRKKGPSTYEIYSSYFDELDFKMFEVLKYEGMLGRLFRGQKIDLDDKNIFIPFCLWRNAIFLQTKQYVPSVVKSKNPYLAGTNG
jgi:hypothetical protein